MFSQKLNQAILQKKTPLCVGLDPRLEWLPSSLKEAAQKKYGATFKAASEAILRFNREVIDVVASVVPAVKFQSAFFEQYGPEGLGALQDGIAYAQSKDLVVILDVKRSDIASTAQAYADAFLGSCDLFGKKQPVYDVDAITVNPFLGADSLLPFVKTCKEYGKGLFILVKTSNPGGADIQDLKINGITVAETVAGLVNRLAKGCPLDTYGYSGIGAVVGATFPQVAARLRKLLPHSIFLVPGYGSQGGEIGQLRSFFSDHRLGALINSSRAIIFSYRNRQHTEEPYQESIRRALVTAREEIDKIVPQL